MVPRKQAGHMTCTRPQAERQNLLAMRASSTHDPNGHQAGWLATDPGKSGPSRMMVWPGKMPFLILGTDMARPSRTGGKTGENPQGKPRNGPQDYQDQPPHCSSCDPS